MEDEQKTEEQQKIINTPLQVTTKNPKRVEAGKRLVEFNKKKREQLNQQKTDIMSYKNIGVCVGLSAIVVAIVYYNYRNRKTTTTNQQQDQQQQPSKINNNKFDMD